jgi:hypothetical protein
LLVVAGILLISIVLSVTVGYREKRRGKTQSSKAATKKPN